MSNSIIDEIINNILKYINNKKNSINLSSIFNPKFLNPGRGAFMIIFNVILIILNFISLFFNNSGFVTINFIYLLIYFYFINCITIKSVCGLHASFTETLKIFDSLKLFWLYVKFSFGKIEKNDYIKELKNILECFNYKNNKNNKNQKQSFNFENMLDINNLNTNLNKKILPKNLKYDDYQPNNKYIFITIYYAIILVLHLNTWFFENPGVFQFLNISAIGMIIFIWTCVVNLPTWILILIIIVCIVIYLVISLIGLYYQYKDKIKEGGDFDNKFLCKPYVIPFVNNSWTNRKFDDNLEICIRESHDNLFLRSMRPFLEAIGKIETQLQNQNGILSSLSGVISVFQEQVQDMASNVYDKIQVLVDKILILRNKIEDIFGKIYDIFKELLNIAGSTKDALVATANIFKEISDKLSWFGLDTGGCFSENTLIKIQNLDKTTLNKKLIEVKIKDIKINDLLEDGSKVIGLYKLKYNGVQMYQYNDVIISGDHYVYENSKIIQIFNSKYSKKCDFNEDYLYCLMTNTNRIRINYTIFGDYFDTDNLKIQNEIQSKTLARLNGFDNIHDLKYDDNKFPLWAFHENTNIKMKEHLNKRIKNIKIGEETYYGKVLGKIELKVDDIYKYKNIITTGDQIIKIRNNWFKIKELNESKKLKMKNKTFYHLIIENTNQLLINDEIFTDFDQYPGLDNFINNKISKL